MADTIIALSGQRAVRRAAMAIAAGFGAQGLGYAAVMTALPSFVRSWGIDEIVVSLILLGTCVTAAAGSLAANGIAIRWGSRVALCVGLGVQATMILTVAFAPAFGVFLAAIVLYGVGLGLVDASQNMQGVRFERLRARPLMGRFYASYTAASIAGALVMSGSLASSGFVTGALVFAAAIQFAVLLMAAGWLDRSRAERAVAEKASARPPLPGRGIAAVGAIVLGAYMLDSAVAAWGTLFLQEGMGAPAALAPLGYAAYQAAVLIARLSTDPIEASLGRMRLGAVALGTGVIACVVIAVSPVIGGVIAGFGLAGLATGALIPLAFSAAGTLLPERSDEVVSRVNLFNYGGAVAGAVVLGLVASGPTLGLAFLIPGLTLLAFTPVLGLFRLRAQHAPTPVPAPLARPGGGKSD